MVSCPLPTRQTISWELVCSHWTGVPAWWASLLIFSTLWFCVCCSARYFHSFTIQLLLCEIVWIVCSVQCAATVKYLKQNLINVLLAGLQYFFVVVARTWKIRDKTHVTHNKTFNVREWLNTKYIYTRQKKDIEETTNDSQCALQQYKVCRPQQNDK